MDLVASLMTGFYNQLVDPLLKNIVACREKIPPLAIALSSLRLDLARENPYHTVRNNFDNSKKRAMTNEILVVLTVVSIILSVSLLITPERWPNMTKFSSCLFSIGQILKLSLIVSS